MKILTLSLFCVIAGVSTDSPFVEGNLRIVPPVKQEIGSHGEYVELLFNDGGTKMIRITDAANHSFDVYVDHRIGRDGARGTIYVNGYPGKPNSVRVLNQNGFKKTILKGLRY